MAFDPHPDANLVSAFLEGELAEPSRRELLRHLSACDLCRRWTMLSHAAWGHARLDILPTPRSAWTWRGLRWEAPLAAAASLALVASGLWLRSPQTVRAPRTAGVVAMHRLADSPALPIRRPRPRRLAAPPANFVLPAPAPVAETSALPPLLPTLPVSPPNAEIQPSIDFSPLMTGFQDQAPLRHSARSELAAWTTPVAASPGPATETTASEPFASDFAGNAAVGANALSGPLAPALAAGLGWAISHSGQVLRSIGTDMWAAVPLVPGVHVRALSASQSLVWAAGRADQLYVSRDHGSHWRQVQLPGVSADPAAIRSILFTDPQHGLVTAADGSSWRTNDGGATWQVAPKN